jgi:hypothetical protein
MQYQVTVHHEFSHNAFLHITTLKKLSVIIPSSNKAPVNGPYYVDVLHIILGGGAHTGTANAHSSSLQ